MTFPVFAGNSASTGYNLTRSLRCRASASAYLNRTPTNGLSISTWTLSFWVKRGTLGTDQTFLSNQVFNSSYQTYIRFNSADKLEFYNVWNTDVQNLITTQVFRDPSAWYHIVVALNLTAGSLANAIKIYVNGSLVTAFSTSTYTNANQASAINYGNYVHNIGRNVSTSSAYFDGYLAEVNFIDNQQLAASSFGSTNTLTGVWQPARYGGTYPGASYYEPFTDNSALTTSSNVGLGKDFSGNGNYWTTNNISITSGVTYDSMTDVPTLTSATAANFAVLNPIGNGSGTLSNANLRASTSTTLSDVSNFAMQTGKWYWEVTLTTASNPRVGVYDVGSALPSAGGLGGTAYGWCLLNSPSRVYYNGATTNYGAFNGNTGDVVMLAYDASNGRLWYGANGTWFASGDPATNANPSQTSVTGKAIVAATASGSGSNTFDYNFGQRPFAYTPPTGFVALNAYNLPTSTIVKGNTVMDATLYTGNGSTQTITNAAGFKPDFVWGKTRNVSGNNMLADSVRGPTLRLISNTGGAEDSGSALTSFNSNGFSVDSASAINQNTNTVVAWQWQAGQGTTSTNTNGTITSTVSVNATAGFSIVSYTGTAANATVGHGLGVAPKFIIVKIRQTTGNWLCGHASLPSWNNLILLNGTNGYVTDATVFNGTAPTSSVFSIGTNGEINSSGYTYIAYCWASIPGFSSIGSYTGNGSATGPFIYTGFQPRYLLVKRSDSTANWFVWDTARNPYNVAPAGVLFPDSSAAEYATSNGYSFGITSNGFYLPVSTAGINGSGGTFIYAAFATNPFKNSLAF